MVNAAIESIGRAHPPAMRQTYAWDNFFQNHYDNNALARRVFKATGVITRHAAVDPTVEDISLHSTQARMQRYGPEATALASAAVADAFSTSRVSAGDVGLLTVVSCTGYTTPGVDTYLADSWKLPDDLQRMTVGHMGCHAALPALRSTADYVNQHNRPALLVCVELTSLHLQPATSDAEQMVAHALFSDGATATVVAPGPGLRVVDVASITDTAQSHLMTWQVTNKGFRMSLSVKVPDVLGAHVARLVNDLLVRNGVDRAAVDGWAVHPGGPRILEVVSDELKLADGALDASYRVLEQHGNCSSPTVMMVVDELGDDVDTVVALAFGPGLTLYGALLQRDEKTKTR